MCKTGGPRCSKEAKEALVKAQKTYQQDKTPENNKMLKAAFNDFLLTPDGLKYAHKTLDDKENIKLIEQEYAQLLAGAKKYETTRDGIKDELKIIEEQIKNTADADEQLKLSTKKATLEGSLKANLARRKNGEPTSYAHMMPAAFNDYFAKTELKHFDANQPGSTFTETKNLNELLTLTTQQRGNLLGDDREELVKRGSNPNGFKKDKRYLMVKTKGTLGSVPANTLPDDTPVKVVQKAEGVAPIIVTEVQQQPETDHAVVVVVDNPSIPGTEHCNSLLITAFPGGVNNTGSNEALSTMVGKQGLTLKDVRGYYDSEDFGVNTQVVK